MMVVHFFGGYRATRAQVDSWAASAKKKIPDLEVAAYPYPLYASAGSPLDEWDDTKEVVAGMAAKATALHILVGHSSGCAIANDVAMEAYRQRLPNFKLIALDGFRPNQTLL